MKTMHVTSQAITKQDLADSLSVFGKQLATEIIGSVREELDSKLGAAKNELRDEIQDLRVEFKADMENLLAEQTLELTQASSDIIQPMQDKDTALEKRIEKLEALHKNNQ